VEGQSVLGGTTIGIGHKDGRREGKKGGRGWTLNQNTYKDFLPAIRGCVAQDPPRTMLCFSSKKSAIVEFVVS
jgi:hypothetical protein